MQKQRKHSLLFYLNSLLLIVFLFLTWSVLNQPDWLLAFDETIQTNLRSPITSTKTFWFKAITFFGNPPTIIIVSLLVVGLLLYQKRYTFAIWFTANITLGAGILNKVLKHLVQRQRPTITHLVSEGGYSFPSGHSAGSMVCYGSILYLIYRLAKNPLVKYAVITILIALILGVGVSRVYLGVHFPTDIIAGFTEGIFFLVISTWILEKIYPVKPSEDLPDVS